MSPNASFIDIQPNDLRRTAQDRRSFWYSLLLAGLVILGLGVFGHQYGAQIAVSGPTELQMAWRFFLALAPSLLWIGLFALLEREEGDVSRVLLLLWFVTAAMYLATVHPLLTYVFQVDAWVRVGWWAAIAADFLIIGPLEMLLVYAVLRFGVYPSSVFRRQVDGPMFGVAAALGIAAVVGLLNARSTNISNVEWEFMASGQRAMAYATLGGWMGYYLGQSRFKRTPNMYLASGFFLVVLFHTLLFALIQGIQALSLFLPRIGGFVVTALFAWVSFLLLARYVRKSNRNFLRMAARVELEQERERPKSLLGDVMRMAETPEMAVETPAPPQPPASFSISIPDDEDELQSLKRSWEALIAEQEDER